jgi:hypothetical protein
MTRSPAIDNLALAGREETRAARFPHWAFRELEAALSDPLDFGNPPGAGLKECGITRFVDGLEDWRRRPDSASPLGQPFGGQAAGRRPCGRPDDGAEVAA